MVMSYEEYCDRFDVQIQDNLYVSIDNLNIPYKVKQRIWDVIMDYSYDILEDRYEDYISEYQDRAYDEYKDSKYEM